MSSEPQLPRRLASSREQRGLTRLELGQQAGFQDPETSIGLIESGALIPHLWAICRLADVLNTSVDYLIGRSDYLLDPARIQFQQRRESK